MKMGGGSLLDPFKMIKKPSLFVAVTAAFALSSSFLPTSGFATSPQPTPVPTPPPPPVFVPPQPPTPVPTPTPPPAPPIVVPTPPPSSYPSNAWYHITNLPYFSLSSKVVQGTKVIGTNNWNIKTANWTPVPNTNKTTAYWESSIVTGSLTISNKTSTYNLIGYVDGVTNMITYDATIGTTNTIVTLRTWKEDRPLATNTLLLTTNFSVPGKATLTCFDKSSPYRVGGNTVYNNKTNGWINDGSKNPTTLLPYLVKGLLTTTEYHYDFIVQCKNIVGNSVDGKTGVFSWKGATTGTNYYNATDVANLISAPSFNTSDFGSVSGISINGILDNGSTIYGNLYGAGGKKSGFGFILGANPVTVSGVTNKATPLPCIVGTYSTTLDSYLGDQIYKGTFVTNGITNDYFGYLPKLSQAIKYFTPIAKMAYGWTVNISSSSDSGLTTYIDVPNAPSSSPNYQVPFYNSNSPVKITKYEGVSSNNETDCTLQAINVGKYTVGYSQAGDYRHYPFSTNLSFEVIKSDQTIGDFNVNTTLYSGGYLTLGGTGATGQPFVFTVKNGPITILGPIPNGPTPATLFSIGNVTTNTTAQIVVSSPGNSYFNDAPTKTLTFTILAPKK
jgi:hypothetical protein